MVTAERIAERREEIGRSADLQALVAHLTARTERLLSRRPEISPHKALLSVDGGVCPTDGVPLAFDPWSPREHRCPRCGRAFTGERHERHWARYQHLWLAERAAELAALAALADHRAAGALARELLAAYGARYFRYPNRDNVLGPSRLFFSTYLESVWLLNYLAAATLLRAADALDDATARGVSHVADEAANLIGDYDEWFSNRQTWNNAALAAIAAWFADEDLLREAIEGRSGLVAHLLEGFRPDGMWYEGENYHLFALRGMLLGIGWARAAGLDLVSEERLARRLEAALLAPGLTALPDFTFPARKDSRFAVSLAQPMYLETWEVGLALLGERDAESETRLGDWLAALYGAPAPAVEPFDSYLHDTGLAAEASRRALSWWALVEMLPELSGDPAAWHPGHTLLADQGLAVLRAGQRYVSLECGPAGGGHGHPDRLHLTVHARGVHWLPDFGTGSYVARDLFWYRSTLAHNAPRLDGVSQAPEAAVCEAFDAQGEWGWIRGRWSDVLRTVVSGPAYVVDVLELVAERDRLLELPWHVAGRGGVKTRGRWKPAEVADGEFVTGGERFEPEDAGPVVLEFAGDGASLTAHLLLDGDLLRAEAPGAPGTGERRVFYLARGRGRTVRFRAVLEAWREEPTIRAVRGEGGVIEVETAAGVERHRGAAAGWVVETPGGRVRLAGDRAPEGGFAPLLELESEPTPARGIALRVSDPPPLDGSLDGFDTSAPLTLDLEDQYRRSEEPYAGAEEFAALAHAAWDDEALYLAVEVTKPELCFRPAGAPPLLLDNEPDDIHSDGLQVYVGGRDAGDDDPVMGFLVVPEPGSRSGGLRVRATSDAAGDPAGVRGSWAAIERGYRVTLAIPWAGRHWPHLGGEVAFDLVVNEMWPGHERRAGQLVWSGGNGWVWLRGDRQDARRFGVLELVA